MSWWVFQILLLATIPLAAEMAHERRRSPRAWAWTAAVIGPVAPLALLMLGPRHAVRDQHPPGVR